MTSLFLTLVRLVGAMWQGLKDDEFRALLFLVVVLLLGGTLFYHRVEGWNLLDSAFFSLITLTTVGYGDLVPTTPLSKVFTMIYLITGMSVLIGFLNQIAKKVVEQEREHVHNVKKHSHHVEKGSEVQH